MFLNFSAYLSDFWNLFDLFRVVLTITYSLIVLSIPKTNDLGIPEPFPAYSYYLLAFLTMLVWVRLLSFLRLFKQTRALIRLVIEVCKDMGAFIMVLSIAVLSFAITANILT